MAEKSREGKRPELVAVRSTSAQEPSSKIPRCTGPARIHQNYDYDLSLYPLNPFPKSLLPDAEWSDLGSSSSDQSRQESGMLLLEDRSSCALVKPVPQYPDSFGDPRDGMHRRRPHSLDHLHQQKNSPRDPDWEFAKHQSSTLSDSPSKYEPSVAESSTHAYFGPNSDGTSMRDGGDFDSAFYRLLDAAALVQQVSAEASPSPMGALSGRSDGSANVFNVLSRLITGIRNRRGGAHGTADIMVIESSGAGRHPEDMEIATGRNQNHPPGRQHPVHESLAIVVRPSHPALSFKIILVNSTSTKSSARRNSGRPASHSAFYPDFQLTLVQTLIQIGFHLSPASSHKPISVLHALMECVAAGRQFLHDGRRRSIQAASGPLLISDTDVAREGRPHFMAIGAPERPLFSLRSLSSCAPSKRPRRKQCGRTRRQNSGMNPMASDSPKWDARMGTKRHRARVLYPTQSTVASQRDGRECATSWRHPPSAWEHRFCPGSWSDYWEFQKGCDETRRFGSQRGAQVPYEEEWNLIDGNSRLKTKIHQTWNFDLHWEVIDFLNDQLDDPEKLRSYFVVTGTEDRAWASTCLEYLQKLWPDSGEDFLESFIVFLKDIRSLGKHRSKCCTRHAQIPDLPLICRSISPQGLAKPEFQGAYE